MNNHDYNFSNNKKIISLTIIAQPSPKVYYYIPQGCKFDCKLSVYRSVRVMTIGSN